MSTAGFDRFRETARFSSPAGPATREELTESTTSEVVREASYTEVVHRQRAVTSLKSGNLFVRDIAVPDDPVAPGGNVRVEVMVSNGAAAIAIFDPDRCTVDRYDPLVGDGGYKTQLRVNPSWSTRDSRDFCIGMAAVGTKDLTFEFVFSAPEAEGVHEIDVSLFLPNTGVGSNIATRAIRVDENGATDPDPNGVDEGDDGDDEERGLIEQATVLVGAVSVALAILVILFGLAAVS